MMRPSTFRTLLLCVALVIGSVNFSLGQQSGSSSYTRPALGGDDQGVELSIVEVLEQSDEHQLMAKAVKTANLTTLLSNYSEGAFTLFAPTDEAFSNLSGELKGLLSTESNAEKEKLLSIVLYHLMSYRLSTEQIASLRVGDVAQGDSLRLGSSDSRIEINDKASIIGGDIDARNGVIHSIDSVLLPPRFR
jgi:uncharacterized surface protein with fasciclin (FAS1) repeats